MENNYPFVITLVGAESSGKTVLAKQLAEALSCIWVPEYAREYLEKLDRPYEFEDLEEIARGQWNLMAEKVSLGLFAPNPLAPPPSEDVAAAFGARSPQSSFSARRKGIVDPFRGSGNMSFTEFSKWLKALNKKIVIVDSGMLTIRMWARIKYGKTVPFVEEAMTHDPTSLHLLCRPRMEWESDPLREAPSVVDRVWIYNQYLKEMLVENLLYTSVTSG